MAMELEPPFCSPRRSSCRAKVVGHQVDLMNAEGLTAAKDRAGVVSAANRFYDDHDARQPASQGSFETLTAKGLQGHGTTGTICDAGYPGTGYGCSMKRMLKDWGLALLIALVVFAALRLLPHDDQPDLPEDAPALRLPALDGTVFNLGDHAGKTVVLNFWATWCGPCKQEIPAFARFHEANPDVVLVGVAVDSGAPSAIRSKAKEWGITWPVVVEDGTGTRAYDVSVLPTTVVIGPDGEVRRAHVGVMTASDLEAAVSG